MAHFANDNVIKLLFRPFENLKEIPQIIIGMGRVIYFFFFFS